MREGILTTRQKDKGLDRLVSLIRKNKKFVMIAHEGPDGDAIGSALAMFCALSKIKKDVRVISAKIPEKYSYLPRVREADGKIPDDMEERIGIAFDTPTRERLGRLEPLVARCRMLVNVDHHISNSRYGVLNWIVPSAAAAGEQVYTLLERLGVAPDRDIAACIYTAVVTDTGKFQYSNTTIRTHQIAAALLSTGMDHTRICEQIYEDYPLGKLGLLCASLKTLSLECRGRVAAMTVTQDTLKKAGITLEWADDIINYARGLRGVEVAVIFKEDERPGWVRISFRSRNRKVDVNKLARQFGGGGHPAAAGCEMEETPARAREKVLAALRKIYADK